MAWAADTPRATGAESAVGAQAKSFSDCVSASSTLCSDGRAMRLLTYGLALQSELGWRLYCTLGTVNKAKVKKLFFETVRHWVCGRSSWVSDPGGAVAAQGFLKCPTAWGAGA